MILYLDTSALVKRYFHEPYSDGILEKWKSATQIVTSCVAYAETMAALYRKKREADLADTLSQKVAATFQRDWQSFLLVAVNDEINGAIDQLVAKYPLRGFDAIHLASALLIHERLPENFLFACFDERLSDAAQQEGLITFSAQGPPLRTLQR